VLTISDFFFFDFFGQKETSKLKRTNFLQIPFFKRKKMQTISKPKNHFFKILPQIDKFCSFGANFHLFSKVLTTFYKNVANWC